MLIGAIVAYVLIQLAVGVWASRRMTGEADYLVAGRTLGPMVLAVSLFATWFGAETVMGASAAVAEGGLAQSRAEPFGYMLALLLMGLLVAGKLRAGRWMTLADFFRDRFGPTAETLCVIANVMVSITWAAAQMTALALIVASLAGLPVGVTLAGAALLVIVYTALGGLMGDVVTDVIQGGVLILGLMLLLGAMILRAGGPAEAIALVDPAALSLVAPDEGWLSRLDAWAVPVLGSLVAVEAISRFLGARSPEAARTGAFGGAGLYLVVGLIPVAIGLIAPGLGVGAGVGEKLIPELARELLSPVLMVLLVGALLSAILSTVDSNILASGGLLTRNLLDRLRPGMTDRQRLLSARVVTALAGLLAWAVAAGGAGIYELIEWTSALGTSGVLIAFLFGAWSRIGAGAAAVGAILAGFASNAVTMVWPALRGAEPMDRAFLLSVVVSLVAYLALAALQSGPRNTKKAPSAMNANPTA